MTAHFIHIEYKELFFLEQTVMFSDKISLETYFLPFLIWLSYMCRCASTHIYMRSMPNDASLGHKHHIRNLDRLQTHGIKNCMRTNSLDRYSRVSLGIHIVILLKVLALQRFSLQNV